MIIVKAPGLNFIRTKTRTKGNSRTGKHMEWESINGRMGRATMESGWGAIKRGMGFGRALMEVHIWGSGFSQKLKGTVFISGQLVISMRENGRTVLKKEQGQNFLQTEMFLLGLIKMEGLMGKDNTNGQTELIMLGTLLTDSNTATANGKRAKQVQSQATKENINETKNMDMEFSTGQVEMFTKAIFKTMSVTAMAS